MSAQSRFRLAASREALRGGIPWSFLEPFCGNLLPKIDKVSEELTLRYPHEGPCVAAQSRGCVNLLVQGRRRALALPSCCRSSVAFNLERLRVGWVSRGDKIL